VDELEQISDGAYATLYEGRSTHVGGALCLMADEAPDSPMLNRVVELGVTREASEEDVDAVLAAMAGRTFYVAVSPSARPAALDAMLAARGLEPGWGWMLFRRPPVPAPPVETTLRVVEADASNAEAWARVVIGAYELPMSLLPWLASVVERPTWHAFLALDGDVPVSSGAVWVDGEGAYFSFGGTDPAHRGRGGQNALFAARVERALELGARTLVTETGERREGRPDRSYRNILRNGFVESHVVAHRLSRPS
jgi:GNAT superfamily N-acetyltransferase